MLVFADLITVHKHALLCTVKTLSKRFFAESVDSEDSKPCSLLPDMRIGIYKLIKQRMFIQPTAL